MLKGAFPCAEHLCCVGGILIESPDQNGGVAEATWGGNSISSMLLRTFWSRKPKILGLPAGLMV
jgi:hypothetical protein